MGEKNLTTTNHASYKNVIERLAWRFISQFTGTIFSKYVHNSNINEEIMRFPKNPLAKFFFNSHSSILVPLMHFWNDSFYIERMCSPFPGPPKQIPV